MIRRYNYTSRKKIPRERAKVILHEGNPSSFDAAISLDDLGLPDDADLILVANRTSRSQRFRYGRVGAIRQPDDRRLTEIGGTPTFRLLVVESGGSGRLLGVANRIPIHREEGEGGDGLQSLLWVQEADIGDEVWRTDFAEHPTLYLNRNIPDISAAVRSDEKFRSLIVPEMFRSLLKHMLLVEEYDPEDDDGKWADWVTLVKTFQPNDIPKPGADDDQASVEDWISETVAMFMKDRFNAAEMFRRG